MVSLLTPPSRTCPRRELPTVEGALLVIILALLIPPSLGARQAHIGADREPLTTRSIMQAAEAARLEVGVPVRRELPKGEAHDYLLALGADEYARVALRQRGVDVTLEVRGGEVQGVLGVNFATGSAGQESVSLLGGVQGDYRLRVRTSAREPEPGGYELTLVERRPATASDRESVAAERIFLAGIASRSQGRTPELLTQRVEKFDEARRRWQGLGDRRGEAAALLNRGMEYHFLDMFSEALASYDEALRIFRELRSPLGEAVVLHNVGITKLRLADNAGAVENFRQALKLFEDEADQKMVSAALYQIGRVYYLEGDLTNALDSYDEALGIRQRLNDRVGEASTRTAIGRVYANGFGDYERAFDSYSRALVLLPPGTSRSVRAQALGDMGRLYFDRRDYQAALEYYQKALDEIANQDKAVRAEILMYRGMVFAAQGEHREALASYEEALNLQRTAKDSVGEGHTLKNMGVSYSAVGDYAEARRHLDGALGIWRRVLYRTAEADTLYEIARVEGRRGNLDEARWRIEPALRVVESLRSKIANQHLRTSYFASAQKFYELYIDVLMRLYKQTGDRSLQAQALTYSELSRARSMLDTLIEARAEVRKGARAEDLKEEAALQRRLSALSQRQMIGSQTPEREAAAIRENLASLVAEYHALEARIRQSSPRYAALTRPEPLSLGQIQSLLAPRQMLLEYALGEERSYLWAVTRSSVESYELPPRSEIEAAAGRVRSLLTERNRAPEGVTDEERRARVRRADEEYLQAALPLSRMLLSKVKSLAAAASLLVVSSGQLQYVPFSALPVEEREAADRQPGNSARRARATVPLLAYHEIETPPSLSVMAELRREQFDVARSQARALVAVIADPVFSPDDDRFSRRAAATCDKGRMNVPPPGRTAPPVGDALPKDSDAAVRLFRGGRVPRLIFTRREACSILNLARKRGERAREILDFDARRELLTESGELTKYRIVHFATHGILDDEHPELSGILLSLYDERRRPREGLVQMHVIYNLSIPAEIVVLSACDTGIGKEIKGEGLPGLSRAFIYAGARRVVASLWEVGDYSTEKLMSSFYRHLLNRKDARAAAALREAQLEIWREDPDGSPYYWAAFVTQGDTRF